MNKRVADRLEIVLASASPRRTELLKLIGLEHTVITSCAEEEPVEILKERITSSAEIVKYLAMQKAMNVARQILNKGDFIIIGADTIVVKDGSILGKPQNVDDALKMLTCLSGEWHEVYTGIAAVEVRSGLVTNSLSDNESTRVKFTDISESAIRRYIDTGEPMDKAGAYGIQGIGALIVERIEGCYFNVIGLPLHRLSKMLTRMGMVLL